MAGKAALELTRPMRGRWLVEPMSGSRHLSDLDSATYARLTRLAKLGSGLDRGNPHRLTYVDRWPRVNSTFRIRVAVDDDQEIDLESSYVTRLIALGAREGLDLRLPAQTLLEQVAQAPPTNAWLLVGDEASFPGRGDLVAQRDRRNPLLVDWTCPRQILRGDLVLMYFVSPRKAIHFATRALFPPVFSASEEVNAVKRIDPHQWWTDLAPFVPVPPVTFASLQMLHGGHLVLRGKPTHYLTPTIIEQIISRFGDLNDEQRLVLQTPVGDPELPDPAKMGLGELRRIAGGALRLEAMVEQYVVEPLLRMAFPESRGNRVRRQVKIPGAGVVDYAVFAGGQLSGVVEVKLGIRRRREGTVRESPDVAQAARYARAAGVPALLVDCNEILFIDVLEGEPVRAVDRQRLTEGDLAAIARHFNATTSR